jgi:nitrogen regulatory protein PII
MKLVTVVIKPFKLEDVREALSSIGIQGLTVTEVKGLAVRKVTPSCTAAPNIASIFCQK